MPESESSRGSKKLRRVLKLPKILSFVAHCAIALHYALSANLSLPKFNLALEISCGETRASGLWPLRNLIPHRNLCSLPIPNFKANGLFEHTAKLNGFGIYVNIADTVTMISP